MNTIVRRVSEVIGLAPYTEGGSASPQAEAGLAREACRGVY